MLLVFKVPLDLCFILLLQIKAATALEFPYGCVHRPVHCRMHTVNNCLHVIMLNIFKMLPFITFSAMKATLKKYPYSLCLSFFGLYTFLYTFWKTFNLKMNCRNMNYVGENKLYLHRAIQSMFRNKSAGSMGLTSRGTALGGESFLSQNFNL